MANLVTKIIISAQDQASNIFDAIQRNAGKLATAVAGYFGFKLFSASVDSAREFETAMSRVQAAAGASADELATLKAAAEEAGATTQYTSVEAAAALENLAKAGLSASDAVATLPAVLDLATAGGVDLAAASDYISKAVAGMGLSFADAGRVADVLAMGANASLTSVEGLGNALSYAAPMAKTLGLSLEQTVAIIGKFADAGIDASRAGTALNSILAQFSNPASTFRRELAAAGITTGNFDQALRQLAAAGPAGQKAIIAVGQEAGPALRSLLNQGIGALDDLKGQLDNASGSARTFAAVMADNLDGASKGLGSAWESLKIKLGEPILGPLKDQINDLAARLREFVTNGTATKFGESITAAFQTGVAWVKGFMAEVDFTAVAARMQGFAAEAGAFFEDFGQKATNAGNVAKLAYNTMSAGFSSVMAVIYKVGEGMSWLTSAVLAETASIARGLAQITFGDLSQSFSAAAQSIQAEAQAAYAVMEEFGDKSGAAFDAATDSAVAAQNAWTALTTPVEQATTATAAATRQLGAAAETIGLTADELDALGNTATVAGGKVVELGKQAQQSAVAQSTAADTAREKLAALRLEYQRLMEAGDTQAAARVLVELQTELGRTTTRAESTAEAVSAAFERLELTSTESLAQAAAAAQRDFEIIRDSGTASATDIAKAFDAFVEAAVAGSENLVSALSGAGNSADATARALEKAIQSAGSSAEIDQLVNKLYALEAAGKLSASAANDLAGQIDDARARIEDMTPGIQSVEEAFRNLGLKSPAELKRIAEAAKESYDVIKASGREAREQLPEAFEIYANAAIAANDGVASAMLKAQAASFGLSIETDKTGKDIVRSMGEAADAVKSVEEGVVSLADAWDASGNLVTDAAGTAADDVRRAASATEEWTGALRANGATGEAWARLLSARMDAVEASVSSVAAAMVRLDRQQSEINSSAARGVDDLKLRLIELNGTEEEIAKARLERDKADVNRQIALLELDIKRANLRGESGEASRLRDEIKLLKEQLGLIDQVHKAEQRNSRSKGDSTSGSRSSSGGGMSSGSAAPPSAQGPDRSPVTRTVRLELSLGGRDAVPLTTTESEAARFISDLEAFQRVAQ